MKDDEDDTAKQDEMFRAEVHKYTNDGYHVITQSDSAVQLKRPKKFSWVWVIVLVKQFYRLISDTERYRRISVPPGCLTQINVNQSQVFGQNCSD